MKKIVMIVLLAVLTLSLYPCKKNKSIVNTSWSHQDQYEKVVIKFITKTDATFTSDFANQEIKFAATYS